MIGWRWWALPKDVLISVTHDTKWTGPTLRADKKPTAKNEHGIYCMATRSAIGQWRPEQASRVYGKIELSGCVVKGERGYRAEQATILALYLKHRDMVRLDCDGREHNTFGLWPDAKLIASLERRYQCDVETVDKEPKSDRSAFITWNFGHSMVPSLFSPSIKYQVAAIDGEPEDSP